MHGRYLTGESATYGRFWAVWAYRALSWQIAPLKSQRRSRKKLNVGAPRRRDRMRKICIPRFSPAPRRLGVEDQYGKLGGNADSGRDNRGRRTGRVGRGYRRQAGRPRVFDHREGRARQFHLQVSGEHGVLYHAGAARDWRPAAGLAV